MICQRGSRMTGAATQDIAHAPTPGPTPSLSQMIEQTELKNYRLQRQVVCQQLMEDASMRFLSQVRDVLEKLQQAADIFEDVQLDMEQELRDALNA